MTIDSATLAYHNRPLKTPTALQGLGARMAPNTPVDRNSPLYKQCQEFEQIFMKMMLKEMQGSLGKDTLMSGGYAEEIFQDMLNDEYASSMTKSAGFGMADQVYRELARI